MKNEQQQEDFRILSSGGTQEESLKRTNWLKRLHKCQEGAVMLEYIVVALLITAAAVAAIKLFGAELSTAFGKLVTLLTGNYPA